MNSPIIAELDKLRSIRSALKAGPTPDTIRAALDAIRQHAPEADPAELDSPRAIREALTEIINSLYWDMAEAAPATQAAPVPICTIALNEGDGRQIISWNPADGLLYSDAAEEPCDGYSYSSPEEATQAAEIIWSYPAWELEII